jgi:hypothetical protein
MTPRERIARLEGLLERVARNASRPRAARGVTTGKASAPDSAPEVVAVAPVAPSAMGHPSETPPPSSVPTAPPPAHAVVESASSAPPWKPEPLSTVQSRPSTMPPEELSDDDLVDVTTIPPAPEPAAALDSSGTADDVEEPPASSRRSKVAAESLDQAIANAAADSAAADIDGREVPIHTPPPESGPQEAVLPAGIEAPRAPVFGELDRELERPPSLGPTAEQLGETIELEEAEGPTIEIEVAGVPAPEPLPERPVEELEVALPRAEMPSGTYDVSISMPAGPPVVHSALPTVPAEGSRGPEITTRPEFDDPDVVRAIRIGDKPPESFKELLDTTLGL